MLHCLVAYSALVSPLAPGLRLTSPVMQLRDTQRQDVGNAAAFQGTNYQNNELSGRVVSTRNPNSQYQQPSQYQSQQRNGQYQTQPRSQYQTQSRTNQFQTSRPNQYQSSRTNQFGSNQFGARSRNMQQGRNTQQGKYATSQDNEILVQGGSLRTWSYKNPLVDEVEVITPSPAFSSCPHTPFLPRAFSAPRLFFHTPRILFSSPRLLFPTPRGSSRSPKTPAGPTTLAAPPHPAPALLVPVWVPPPAPQSAHTPLLNSPCQVELSTEGRPLDADIELWHGPDNTPVKMRVYVENGAMRPFRAVIATPRGPNTIALRNIGQLEFPFAARGKCSAAGPSLPAAPAPHPLPLPCSLFRRPSHAPILTAPFRHCSLAHPAPPSPRSRPRAHRASDRGVPPLGHHHPGWRPPHLPLRVRR
jgi:hypothetical protein